MAADCHRPVFTRRRGATELHARPVSAAWHRLSGCSRLMPWWLTRATCSARRWTRRLSISGDWIRCIPARPASSIHTSPGSIDEDSPSRCRGRATSGRGRRRLEIDAATGSSGGGLALSPLSWQLVTSAVSEARRLAEVEVAGGDTGSAHPAHAHGRRDLTVLLLPVDAALCPPPTERSSATGDRGKPADHRQQHRGTKRWKKWLSDSYRPARCCRRIRWREKRARPRPRRAGSAGSK